MDNMAPSTIKKSLITAIVAGLIVVVVGIGIYLYHKSHTSPNLIPKHPEAVIEFTQTGFSPGQMTVPKGFKVTWVNHDLTFRGVRGINFGNTNAPTIDSKQLNVGERYSVTFTKPGTYTYQDVGNLNYTGSITVLSQTKDEIK